MLDLARVAQALAAKKDLFGSYEEAQGSLMAHYRERWVEAAGLSRAEIERRLAPSEWPGARPSAEHDRYHSPIVGFAQRWQNHEEARAWAGDVLRGLPTIAVDGSQIAPSRDFFPPIGAIQVGWFENRHEAAASYVKEIEFEVLAPQELAEAEDQDGAFPGEQVNWRRFQGECRRLIACMGAHRTQQRKPVCFFDGSLIVSFAQHMRPEHQARYVRAVMELLEASASCRVPLIGYVDTSYAADLVAMLDTLAGSQGPGRAPDGAFLRPLMQWGDRTPAWLCARHDAVEPLEGGKYYGRVGFVYLKTTAANPPVRLDFPRWLVDEDRLEEILDVVRAECVVGNGYPYAVETADAVAVITMEDRERFYRAVQRFASREGLPLRYSRKAGSKLGRR